MASEQERQQARKGRIAALVIAGAMVLWLALQWVGQQMDWPARYAFLIDFAALGALIWALVVSVQIWRARRDDNANGQG
jgi:uncharacterized integral membrane protein